MKLVVGAPVGPDREWALPHWFYCLAKQSRPPDEYVFVISDACGARAVKSIRDLCPADIPRLSYAMDSTPFIPREQRSSNKPEYVFGDFAKRRNALLRMVRQREPDVFLSLDTDVMLEDRRTIERLLSLLETRKKICPAGPDLTAPCVYLHPTGRPSECYNAGIWAAGEPGSPERAWLRVTADEAACGVQAIDIPMAAVMMTRKVLDSCQYRFHRSGEDLGFAQDLDRLGFTTLWDPDLETRHVMSREAL